MAKISARGAVKLAEAHLDMESSDWPGGVARTIYVLRSDGVVLRATQFPQHPQGAYDRKRTGYVKVGKLAEAIRAGGRPSMLLAFERFAARKGAVLV
jgi:hypothetical protein